VILFAAPLVKDLPLAALAGILFMVAYHMGDWGEIPEILKLSRADIAVWLLTLSLTVFADLTLAVEVGMILAAFTFIRKIPRQLQSRRLPTITLNLAGRTSCKTKTFPHTPRSTGFTALFCLA
jgi:SulP family sulfate permease